MQDERIIELFFERSEHAVAELAAKYGGLCKTIALNILGNEQDAEECVNDAYLAVWDSVPPRSPEALGAYLCKITRNLSLKKYHFNTAEKRNSRYDAVLEEFESCLGGRGTVEDEVLARELSLQINLFLGELGERDRAIFVRRYWFCDPVADIADRAGMSVNSVKVRLHRIREKLKAYLKEEGLL